MRVAPHYILVRIDKNAQRERREKLESGIYLSALYIFMQRNLQYGEVLQIGSVAAKNFPEAQVGDIALFHHMVEDEDADGERLVSWSAEEELRTLKGNEDFDIFGFIKPDGTLIAVNQHIFLEETTRRFHTPKTAEKPSSLIFGYVGANGEVVETGAPAIVEDEDEVAALQKELDALTFECEKLKQTAKSRQSESSARDINMVLEAKYRERKEITMKINKTNLHVGKVIAISKSAMEEMDTVPGDEVIVEKPFLYPLEIMGKKYYKIETQYTVAKMG